MKILVVEDDPKIAGFLEKGLKESGHSPFCISNGKEALEHIKFDQSIELIILDLMLPEMDGLTILQKMREDRIETPVLILSARRSVEEKVKGFSQGADDYLEKPFAFSELLARIEALNRRRGAILNKETRLTHFGITIDLLKHEVRRDNELIDLQPKEFSLLEYFMRNPEKVLSKTLILERVYQYNFDTQSNIVDVLVCRLRNKIDKDFHEKTIHTLRGIGYVFKKE